jgi:hypothetical protein
MLHSSAICSQNVWLPPEHIPITKKYVIWASSNDIPYSTFLTPDLHPILDLESAIVHGAQGCRQVVL